MDRIAEIGAAGWLEEIPQRYACPGCGAINSGYDLSCRRCGETPGSAFACEHGDAIRTHLRGRS